MNPDFNCYVPLYYRNSHISTLEWSDPIFLWFDCIYVCIYTFPAPWSQDLKSTALNSEYRMQREPGEREIFGQCEGSVPTQPRA